MFVRRLIEIAAVMTLSTALETTAAAQPNKAEPVECEEAAPHVLLVLDASCSMMLAPAPAPCPYWNSTHGLAPATPLNKNQYTRAALTGCAGPGDGFVDEYAGLADLAAWSFGYSATPYSRLLSPFFAGAPALETAIDGLPIAGASPITLAIRDAGQYFGLTFNAGNSSPDAKNYLILITDGNPNSYGGDFNYACNGAVRSVAAAEPWLGTDYLANSDVICGLVEAQAVITYVIAIGDPSHTDPTVLQNTATLGGGEYYFATNEVELRAALDSVMTSILSR